MQSLKHNQTALLIAEVETKQFPSINEPALSQCRLKEGDTGDPLPTPPGPCWRSKPKSTSTSQRPFSFC